MDPFEGAAMLRQYFETQLFHLSRENRHGMTEGAWDTIQSGI